MFLIIEGTWQLVALLFILIAFGFLSWRKPVFSAAIILFITPSYLLKIDHWPLTVLELFLAVFAVCWLARKAKEGVGFKKIFSGFLDLFGPSYFAALILIIAGTSIATALSVDWRSSAGIFKSWVLEPIIFSLILAEIIKDKKELRLVILGLFFSSILVALAGLLYKLFGQATFDNRLAGWYLSPNHLAMYLVPGLILAWWGLWTGENKKQKTGFLLAILILGLALYFTFSYGAWLGLFAAIIFVLFCLRRFEIIDRRQSSIAYCLLLVFTAIIFFTQLNFGGNDKLVSLLTSPRSSWQSRLMVWQSAGKILESHWLIGIGPGLFQKYYLEYQSFFSVPYLEWAVPQPHNLFLAWWLQGGILGLIGFLVLSVTYCKNIILGSPQNNNHFLSGLRCSEEGQRGLPSESKSYPSTGSGNNFLVFSSNLFLDKQKRLLIIFLAAVFVYILIHGLVDTPYWKNDLALVFWSIVSLGYRASRCCD